MDRQIGELTEKLKGFEDAVEYETTMTKVEDLTKVRCQLAESRTLGSNAKEWIAGSLGFATTVLVLKHEKTDVITSKAFGLASKLFRRG